LPFFLFSATAGQLADKFDQAKIIRVIKLFEIVLVFIGGIAFYYGMTWLLMLVLTGMGVHSTFFGPIKYSILPNLLQRQLILGATALVEASTFMAILLGTLAGTLTIGGVRAGSYVVTIVIGGVAIAGFLSSCFIPQTFPQTTNWPMDWNLLRATKSMIKATLANAKLAPAIFVISWFWLIGAVILTKLPDYTNYVLRGDSTVFAVFLALFSIGIATGSLIINSFLSGKNSLRFVPHAMVFMSFFIGDLYWVSPDNLSNLPLESITQFFNQSLHCRIAMDLFLLALSGGVFVVPLYTFLQLVSDGRVRSQTIAANNIINALFIVAGMGLVSLLLYFRVAIVQVFLMLALLNLVVVVFWVLFYKNTERINFD
jgi:MFS family permease